MSHEFFKHNENKSSVSLGGYFTPADNELGYFGILKENGMPLNELFTPPKFIDEVGLAVFKVVPQWFTNRFRGREGIEVPVPYLPKIEMQFDRPDIDHSELITTVCIEDQEFSSYVQFKEMGVLGEFFSWKAIGETREDYPLLYTPEELLYVQVKIERVPLTPPV